MLYNIPCFTLCLLITCELTDSTLLGEDLYFYLCKVGVQAMAFLYLDTFFSSRFQLNLFPTVLILFNFSYFSPFVLLL